MEKYSLLKEVSTGFVTEMKAIADISDVTGENKAATNDNLIFKIGSGSQFIPIK